ncbi:DMT family transporter [Streptomyces fradiae]|uniref:DMT family transporter n=1 Tax=Streptomyces fradiae TaxID=1906 RepID=UPI002943342A|nr:DMT family transporter [Streptomyces fradiae]WOI59117.1 DMT family transporter [Streptomyces fradiae]
MSTSDRAAKTATEAGPAAAGPAGRAAAAPAARPSGTWLVDLGVLGVAIVWGSTYVAMQWSGQFISVPAFLFLRFAMGALVITLLSLHAWRKVSREEFSLGVLFGVLLFGILFLETLGVRYTLASNAGFLISLSVMLVPLIERIFLRARIAPSIYPLTLLSLAGCALLTLNQGFSVRSGDLIILAAAVIRAAQIVLFGSRAKGRELSLVRVTAIELWVVAAGGLLFSLVQPARSWHEITHLPGDAWLVIAYLGVAGTAFAFLTQLHAARVSSPTRVGLVLSTEPFFAAVFAVVLLSEHLGPLQLAGGALVLLSAYLGRWVDARRRTPPPPAREVTE